MAEFYLKLKTKDNNLELKSDLSLNSSLTDLQNKVSNATGIPITHLKILSFYPRKQLDLSRSESIQTAGIRSGDTLFVEEDKNALVVTNVPTAVQSTATAVSSETQNRSHVSDDDDFIGVTGILLKKDVPSDNSCLFSSLEFVLSGKLNTSNNSYMRQLVADTIISHPDDYNDAILGKPVSEYCKWILNPNSWGGAIEIAILSEYFGFEVVVVSSTTGNICRFGEDKCYDQRVFLLFDGIHYDPLYMDFTVIDKIQTIFPTSDENVLRDAEQLAQEAKLSKQYTDVNQFMICCKICNSVFVGQKEAQVHAKQTGHTSFDEVVS